MILISGAKDKSNSLSMQFSLFILLQIYFLTSLHISKELTVTIIPVSKFEMHKSSLSKLNYESWIYSEPLTERSLLFLSKFN